MWRSCSVCTYSNDMEPQLQLCRLPLCAMRRRSAPAATNGVQAAVHVSPGLSVRCNCTHVGEHRDFLVWPTLAEQRCRVIAVGCFRVDHNAAMTRAEAHSVASTNTSAQLSCHNLRLSLGLRLATSEIAIAPMPRRSTSSPFQPSAQCAPISRSLPLFARFPRLSVLAARVH